MGRNFRVTYRYLYVLEKSTSTSTTNMVGRYGRQYQCLAIIVGRGKQIASLESRLAPGVETWERNAVIRWRRSREPEDKHQRKVPRLLREAIACLHRGSKITFGLEGRTHRRQNPASIRSFDIKYQTPFMPQSPTPDPRGFDITYQTTTIHRSLTRKYRLCCHQFQVWR
jgi:hypothetical protein